MCRTSQSQSFAARTLRCVGLRPDDKNGYDEDYRRTARLMMGMTAQDDDVDAEEDAGCLHKGLVSLGLARAYNPYPQDDPFYSTGVTTQTLSRYKPGDVLRTRSIKLTPFPGLDAAAQMCWQVAYVYSDASGRLGVTVLVVIRPPGATGDKVILQLPKTDASIPQCRTSYSLRKGAADRFASLSESVFIAPFLDRKWITVLPDYNGQFDAFGDGPLVGRCVLDAMRATVNFKGAQLKPDAKLAVWGYSSGAQAMAWASSLQAQYAPELTDRVVGWAGGGLPVNVHGCALHMNDSIASGLIIGVMAGLSNVEPELKEWAQKNQTKDGKKLYDLGFKHCFAPYMLAAFEKNVLGTEYWKMEKPLSQPIPQKVLQRLDLSNASMKPPTQPLLLLASFHDEVVPLSQPDALVDSWGKQGATIEYVRDKLSGHVILCFTGFPMTIDWLDDRFAGKPTEAKKGSPVVHTVETALTLDDDEAKKALSDDRRRQMSVAADAFKSKPFFF